MSGSSNLSTAGDLHLSNYEMVIQPNRAWLQIQWRQIWEYRDLLYLFVRREVLARYRQTILGPLWFILQPLLTTAVFTVIFGRVAQISTDGLPPVLFYLCGLLSWNYVQQNIQNGGAIFTTNANLFGKVYFPRLVLPFAMIVANLVALALQFTSFLILFAWFKFYTPAGSGLTMHSGVFLLPLLVVQTAALSLGVCLWTSSLTAKYRDLTHLLQFLVQLWMFATPIIYPLSSVTGKWRVIADLNPMAAIVELFRYCLLGTGAVNASTLIASVSITVIALITGILMFQRTERTFIDTV